MEGLDAFVEILLVDGIWGESNWGISSFELEFCFLKKRSNTALPDFKILWDRVSKGHRVVL